MLLMSPFIMEQIKLYRLRHLLTLSKALAEELKCKLNDGQPMIDLVSEYSACPSAKYGGDLGWMQLDEFPNALHESITALTLDHWEGPINDWHHFHFLELLDCKEVSSEMIHAEMPWAQH